MDSSNEEAVSAFNDTTEEGEITEDVEFEGGLAYDSVSSNSFSASLPNESQSPFNFKNEGRVSGSSRNKSRQEKINKIKRSSHVSEKNRSRFSSPPASKRHNSKEKSVRQVDGDDRKKSVLHRTKASNVICELNPSKSTDVIFLSDEDHNTHGFVSVRRDLTQEKENSGGHRRSKSSDKDSKCSRKRLKHRKHSSRCSSDYHSHDSLASRKRTRREEPSKHGKDKVHRHNLNCDSDSDIRGTDSNKHRRHSYSHREKLDPTCRSLFKEALQKKPVEKIPQREPQVISSEYLNRFKDNILMRKLLESGTIKSRRDSEGSDLNCEIGSISTVSSPDFEDLFEGLFEDLHSKEDSVDSNEVNEKPEESKVHHEVSDEDSEIEVIIPEKKQPELIDLKSDSDNDETVKLDVVKEDSIDQLSVMANAIGSDQDQINECVNSDSPQPLVTLRTDDATDTEFKEMEKNCGDGEISENNRDTEKVTNQPENKNGPENCSLRSEHELINQEHRTTIANEIEDEDDLQLRLVALRSAVLKKHMDRLQKRGALKSGAVDNDLRVGVNQPDISEKDTNSDCVENCIVNDKVPSPQESVYCPTNRTSPYSPTSSYSLSLGGDNDNIVGEQDMEIAATDEDETCIDEQNVQISSNCEVNHAGSGEGITAGEQDSFKSQSMPLQMFAMGVHSSDTTLDSFDPSASNNFSEVPPQPLPPGVELSNLPPEFNHSFFVSQETVNNSNTFKTVDLSSPDVDAISLKDQSLSSSVEHRELNSGIAVCRPSVLGNEFTLNETVTKVVHHVYYHDTSCVQSDHQRFLLQLPVAAENRNYFCSDSRVPQGFDKNDSNSQEFSNCVAVGNSDANEVSGISSKHSHEVTNFEYSIECEKEKGNDKSYGKENGIFESGDSHLDCASCETLSRSSLLSENSKLGNVHLEIGNEEATESGGKTHCTQNYAKAFKTTTTLSEKSHDSFHDEEEDENVLRANLLTSLGNLKRTLPNETVVQKVERKKPINVRQKTVMRKRIVLGQPIKRNIISSSLSDNGSLPFNFGRKKFKESLQITLPVSDTNCNNLQKSFVRKRRIIPSNPLNNMNSKFIIKIGEDSDSPEEQDYSAQKNINSSSDGDGWLRRVSIRDSIIQPSNKSNETKSASDTCPPELEKSVDLLLKQIREQHEIKSRNDPSWPSNKNSTKRPPSKTVTRVNQPVIKRTVQSGDGLDSLTPLAVRHLPKSQQEEYRRLKQQILEKERLKRLKPPDEQHHQVINLTPGQPQAGASLFISEVGSKVAQQTIPVEGSSNENESSSLTIPANTETENVCRNCRQKNVSNSVESAEREVLTESETNLVIQRYNVIDNILEMDLLIRQYDQRSESYDSASKEVSRLQEQLKKAELHLENCKKELDVSKKDIIAGHKKLSESRITYSESEKSCNEVGSRIIGASYELPKAAAELMTKRLTGLLRIRKKYLMGSDIEKDSCSVKSQSSVENDNVEVNVNKRLSDDDIPLVDDSQQTKRIKQSEDKITSSLETNIEDNVFLLNSDRGSDTGLIPYVSPLTHLHGGLSRRPAPVGKSNHDAILCPYDLRGSCLDDACPYQH